MLELDAVGARSRLPGHRVYGSQSGLQDWCKGLGCISPRGYLRDPELERIPTPWDASRDDHEEVEQIVELGHRLIGVREGAGGQEE